MDGFSWVAAKRCWVLMCRFAAATVMTQSASVLHKEEREPMHVNQETIDQILHNVFADMLGMEIERIPDQVFEDPSVVASIKITGEADQVIVVEAPVATANLIAETMFAAEPGTLNEEEVRDATGEVVNIIGGNVKGFFGDQLQLSLPTVSDCRESLRNGEYMFVSIGGHPAVVRWQTLETASA